MIDPQISSYPDMTAIIKTCKTKMFMPKYEHIINDNITALYEEQSIFGMLSDEFFEGFDLCLDRNNFGSIVSRTSECKSWQRAKYLSTNYQLRLEKVQLLEDDSSKRGVEVHMQTDDIHCMNISYTENILNIVNLCIMPHPRPQYPYFNLLSLHVFVGYSRPML